MLKKKWELKKLSDKNNIKYASWDIFPGGKLNFRWLLKWAFNRSIKNSCILGGMLDIKAVVIEVNEDSYAFKQIKISVMVLA